MFNKVLTILPLLSVAAAQLLGLSAECTQTLTRIATSPDVARCLNPSPFLSILTGSGDTSIVDPVNSFLTSICATGPCSNDTFATIVNNVTAGCGVELGGLGYQGGDNTALISDIQQYYPVFRQAACLKDGNNLCVTEILTGIQNIVGTLSPSNIPNVIFGGVKNSTGNPLDVSCSKCSKAIYNVAARAVPDLVKSQDAQAQCGASFVDGQDPAGVTESAVVATKDAGKNGATGLPAGSGVSVLFVILGVFFVLV